MPVPTKSRLRNLYFPIGQDIVHLPLPSSVEPSWWSLWILGAPSQHQDPFLPTSLPLLVQKPLAGVLIGKVRFAERTLGDLRIDLS